MLSKEQEELLNTPIDGVTDVEARPRKQHDVHGDRQRYLADSNSQWEVSVAGVEVSSGGEDFDAAMRLYDRCIKHHDTQVCVTYILNGARTVFLRSPVVKYRDKPKNPVGISWEDE